MKKLVVLSFFALGSIYFVACNKESLSPDSEVVSTTSAASAADSTKHKGKGMHGDSMRHKKDSLGHKKDSLATKPPKGTPKDSLNTKPKKGPKKG